MSTIIPAPMAPGIYSSRSTSWKLFLLIMIFTGAASAQSKFLDPTFGDTGVVVSACAKAAAEVGESVVLRQDGKIILAGFSYDMNSTHSAFTAARYNADGVLDSTFGSGGFVRVYIAGGDSIDECFSAALQQDGKIVLAGFTKDPASGDPVFGVARLDTDGTPDNSFGTGGTVMTAVSASDKDDRAYAVAIQADGKIVVAGDGQDQSYHAAFAAVRLNQNGSIDSSFGTDGAVRMTINGSDGINDWGTSAAVQKDGKIVIAGYSESMSPTTQYAFAAARLNSDGSPDVTFGTNGSARVFISSGYGFDYCRAMAIQPDGKIVLAGTSCHDLVFYHTFAIARLDTDGTVDTTFGTNGSVKNYISGSNSTFDDAYAVAIQQDGRIVACGLYSYSVPMSSETYQGIAVARYTAAGTPDSTFGTAGSIGTALGYAQDVSHSVVIQPDGKILVGGVEGAGLYAGEFAIVRYLPGNVTGVLTSNGTPEEYVLSQNYPNPFNPTTDIEFRVANVGFVSLKVYDVLGREVRTLVNKVETPGKYNVTFDAGGMPSGVYFCRLSGNGISQTRKMVLLK